MNSDKESKSPHTLPMNTLWDQIQFGVKFLFRGNIVKNPENISTTHSMTEITEISIIQDRDTIENENTSKRKTFTPSFSNTTMESPFSVEILKINKGENFKDAVELPDNPTPPKKR